ncbi:MAG TPA: single-stranded DNA-binding protein [Gemmatimonadaceae bacterium]|nr:single-stranded DNA-binding protein [Gemmatimonadaceae bacterium]
MSRSVNKVTLIGNLGNEPEIRTTAGGGKVATFSLATSRSWNGAGGEKQEKTEWHRCVAWNGKTSGTGLADIVEKYCKKGERVFVEGSIEYGQYKDKEGQTRYTTEIKVRELMLLGGGGRGADFDSDGSDSSRSRTPARSAGKTASGTENTFDDFPAALEDQDDDLPF